MVRNLLSRNENRRLNLINVLAQEKGWVHLSELSEKLGASVRVLKDDLAFFRNEVDDFTIRTSNQGVRLSFKKNKGLKTISQKILADSIPYQILETVFLDESLSVNELANKVFVSQATIYRTIKEINAVISNHGFQIKTNPCQILGDEQKIRYFAYQYFNERYSRFVWLFPEISEKAMDNFLTLTFQMSQVPIDYAYFNAFKSIATINLFRYKNNHLINTDHLEIDIQNLLPDLDYNTEIFRELEDELEVVFNEELMEQILTGYIQKSFSANYDHLIEKTKIDPKIAEEVNFLDDMLTNLAIDQNIPMHNKESIILITQNVAHLEYWEPHSGYILYNQHAHFVRTIKEEFPLFYEPFYEGIKQYRKLIDVPMTKKSINYLVYTIFTYWKNLIPELRKKYKKIKTLVISDSHVSHAQMLRDFLIQEHPTQLEVDVFKEVHLSKEKSEELPYDLIITNFPFPELESKELVYIQNVPTYNDISRIQAAISDIIEKRKEE